jgi:hypothetical protein
VAYNISKLKANTPIINSLYFLDANVWVYALQYLESPSPNYWEQVYVDFFDDLINERSQPKILMPSVLVSEIINTYIRDVPFKEFKNKTGKLDAHFKKDFRPSSDYLIAYHSILDDLKSYKNCIQFIDDSCILNPSPQFLSKDFTDVDFNDKYYFHLLKELSKTTPLTIVTNDGDFHIEDIPILTVHKDLLAL